MASQTISRKILTVLLILLFYKPQYYVYKSDVLLLIMMMDHGFVCSNPSACFDSSSLRVITL